MKKKRISADEDDRGELIVDSTHRLKIWLVWSIGEYKNGFPMVDLRAVATTKEQAEKYKDLLLKDWFDEKRELRGMGLSTKMDINIEERITNHCYGLSMSLLKYLVSK